MRWVWIYVAATLLIGALPCRAQEEDGSFWDGATEVFEDIDQTAEDDLAVCALTGVFFGDTYESLRNAMSNNPDHSLSDTQKAVKAGGIILEVVPVTKGAQLGWRGGRWVWGRSGKLRKLLRNCFDALE